MISRTASAARISASVPRTAMTSTSADCKATCSPFWLPHVTRRLHGFAMSPRRFKPKPARLSINVIYRTRGGGTASNNV